MSIFDSPSYEGHEAVHAFHDPAAGLKCVIAVHSTARGASVGGCRMWAYPSDEAATEEALRLSRAMSYKAAVADLELGGGKAIIIGDARHKTPELFEALGRAVEKLAGRYWAAEDVGVSPSDLAHARKHSRYVAGLHGHPAASGDPSPVTAEGVLRGIRAAVKHAYGSDLNGVTVAVQGVGRVGAALAEKLKAEGAHLILTDLDAGRLREVAGRLGAETVRPEMIYDMPAQVFAPCAMGGVISLDTLARLRARVIAGGANSQIASPEACRAVFEKGMVYAPDFVINGGGVINVAAEIRALDRGEAYDPEWVELKLQQLTATLEEILVRSRAENRPTNRIAKEIARERMGAAVH